MKSLQAYSPKLVRVRYMDHVLFRYVDPRTVGPVLREAVGWIIAQDDEAVTILFDRALELQEREKPDLASGLRILRSCIKEIEEIG
ncbi:MAG: hypothetical protein ABSA11_05670 [Candidatus Bathyarchaeia archaeon]